MLATTFILLGTGLSITGACQRDRRIALTFSILCAGVFMLYWFTIGQITAAMVCVIAMASTLVQLITPPSALQKTLLVRLGVAGIAAIIAASVSYQVPSDIIPLVAFLIARSSETQSNNAHIRMGYIASSCLWLYFSVSINNPIMIVANAAIVTMQVLMTLRDMNALSFLKLGAGLARIKRIGD